MTSLAQVHIPPLFSHDLPLPLHCRWPRSIPHRCSLTTYRCRCTVAFTTTSLAQVHTPPLFSHDLSLLLHCRVHYDFAGPGPYPTVVLSQLTAVAGPGPYPTVVLSRLTTAAALSLAQVHTPPLFSHGLPLQYSHPVRILSIPRRHCLSQTPPGAVASSAVLLLSPKAAHGQFALFRRLFDSPWNQRPLMVILLFFIDRWTPLQTKDRSWSICSLSSFAGLPFKPKTAHGQFANFRRLRSLNSPSNQRPLTVNLRT
ncbi:hypothetical protein H4582DRAFT_2079512 [Lactarius indigo]|nr:hypothetical protein H4582DRAFT_2079512 [Lactarius indigo]